MDSLPAWLTKTPFAHRGLHDEFLPENSLGAFKAAAGAGYGMELDVQLTLDGEMVVFHDKDLTRMASSSKEVQNCSYQYLRRFKLLSTEERIPLLHQVCSEIKATAPLLIEIKPGRNHKLRASATAEVLQQYCGDVAVQSFDPRIVAWFKKHTKIPAGQIMGRYKEPSLPKELRRKLEFIWREQATEKADFVAFDLKKLTPEISDMIRAEKPLLTWTVKDELKLSQARVLADNLIFERVKP